MYHKSEDRKIEEIFHGGWFFITAGTQSTGFLGVIIAEHATRQVMFIQLFSFALWSIGASLYLIFYGIHYHEINFLPVQKQYSAITLLDERWSGCFNGAYRRNIVSVYSYRRWTICRFPPISEGDFLFFWSVGLWWLPFLVVLAIRKQAYGDEGLVFTVGYWEIAFTLGLYANSTIQLVELFKGQYLDIVSMCFSIACIALWCFSSVFTIVHLVRSSIWVPVNDLTLNYVIPYSFKLRGRLFNVKEVVNEWLDQTIQGVLKKRYCVVTTDNLTCLISYDISAKKWYFDQVKD